MPQERILDLFGGSRPWAVEAWTASDDRVRGGQSQSYLDVHDLAGRFHGDLDITTLGGAGFASQRTTGEDHEWDLSSYDGIRFKIDQADGKRYTIILKDTLLPPNSGNGREQATTSYEFDFDASVSDPWDGEGEPYQNTIFIPWTVFHPTYRGRDQDGAQPLNTASIKRFSIMMRSFFGSQEGPFDLTISSISAYSHSTPNTFEDQKEPVNIARDSSSDLPETTGRSTVALFCMTGITIIALATLGRRFISS